MTTTTTPSVDLERFNEQGYLIIDDLLDLRRDIDPVVKEYNVLLESLVTLWLKEGKLSATYRDLPFAERLAHVLNEVGPASYQPFDISLPLASVTEETPIHLGPATFALLTCPRLVDVIEQFLGPEILSNPIQHVRIKPPERLLTPAFRTSLVGRADWHQDQGVALPEIDDTQMLTVWIPVTDATVENGCLVVGQEGIARS